MVLTKCPKIYRKSVLHMLRYTANLYAGAVQICKKFWDTQYIRWQQVVHVYSEIEIYLMQLFRSTAAEKEIYLKKMFFSFTRAQRVMFYF